MGNLTLAWIGEQVIIDGVAGHLIPPTETEKLRTVRMEDGTPIAEFSEDFSRFSVNMPDGPVRNYEVILEQVNRQSGFKAVAYREIDPATGEPKMDERGRCELRMSFQGLVAGKGDFRTGLRAAMGRKAAQHVDEVEAFTTEAVERVGGAEMVSALISGSHSYGVVNAIESYRVARDLGIESVEMVLMESVGAAAALADMAHRVADGNPEQAKAFMEEVTRHTTTVNAVPSSHFTKMARGEAVGTLYHLHVPTQESKVEKAKDGIHRHRLGTLMQSVLNRDELIKVGAMPIPEISSSLKR